MRYDRGKTEEQLQELLLKGADDEVMEFLAAYEVTAAYGRAATELRKLPKQSGAAAESGEEVSSTVLTYIIYFTPHSGDGAYLTYAL